MRTHLSYKTQHYFSTASAYWCWSIYWRTEQKGEAAGRLKTRHERQFWCSCWN